MASSMGKSVLGQGSDFVDEDMKQCQPCSFQGKSVAANTFCVDCDTYLCTQCTTYHKALKTTQTHALIKPDDAKKVAPKSALDKCTRKCSVHPAKAVKYFCVAHSHLGCSVCCNIDHKRCDDVEHIQTVAADIKRHAGFNKFDDDLHTLGTAYKSGLVDITNYLKNLQEDEQHLRKTYAKFRKDVNDGLDKLEREIFKQTKNIKDEETRKLAALSKNLDKSKSTVDGLIQKLDMLLSSGHKCDAYVLAKTDQKEVTSLREELARAFDGKTYRRYEFKQNLDVTKAGALGELTTREDAVSSSSAGLPRRAVMDGPVMVKQKQSVDAPRRAPMDGPAMAKLMKKGTRVRRGEDWRQYLHGDRDGGAGQLGTVTGSRGTGYFYVKWDNGNASWNYRMGANGAYELEIVQ